MDLSSTGSLSPLAQTEIRCFQKCSLQACVGIPTGWLRYAQEHLSSSSWSPVSVMKTPAGGTSFIATEAFSGGGGVTIHANRVVSRHLQAISTAQSHTGFPTEVGRMPVFPTLGHIFLSLKVALLECRVHRLSREAALVWGSPIFTLVLKHCYGS